MKKFIRNSVFGFSPCFVLLHDLPPFHPPPLATWKCFSSRNLSSQMLSYWSAATSPSPSHPERKMLFVKLFSLLANLLLDLCPLCLLFLLLGFQVFISASCQFLLVLRRVLGEPQFIHIRPIERIYLSMDSCCPTGGQFQQPKCGHKNTPGKLNQASAKKLLNQHKSNPGQRFNNLT